MKKAVVLLSGGLDSATALYLAKAEGYEVYAISFDYGQRHNKELLCAAKLAEKAGVKQHITIKTNMEAWGGSALTDRSIDIPKGDENRKDIPVTYVPARNMIFLSYAASYAETIGSQDIFIGVSQVDYSGYVDCRQEFINAMEHAINMGTVCAVEHGKKIKIHAPFIHMKKSEEIQLGMKLGVDYSFTWSCYRGEDLACGVCDSCVLRLKAFHEAGYGDPIKYKGNGNGKRINH
ncbi:MAG: 7-cyano-7-deazaguanine synthase [Petroclostridium sp.]|uniref:7-cyano-7-deazaguanine synthase QueC n=1 Tax=Petroclostridium xylanilyticum TaxID=1792311 RepID=UPI000B982B46|nr:7-cyano-7-deazaguanine synthase QueC [Petroclostridium xylanilyticum]MBZ4644918.1 queuosine biosynthesis protein QueC [Clostridia bacterium]MDK2810157.1 7-cyano-7-deazaguanine synthase [Petroclostridium sp.]